MTTNPARAALLAFLDNLTVPAVAIVTPLGEGQSSQVFQLNPSQGDCEADVSGDILRFLEDRNGPMTVNQLLEAFEAEATDISERSIKRRLRALIEQGKVERPRPGGPPGYRRTTAAR